MRATPSRQTPRSRACAALLATLVASLMLVPAAALADDHDAGLVELPGVVVDDENVPPADDTDETDTDAAATNACDDRLVTISPEASDGEVLAVAITASAVEEGLDGWVNVAWEAAEGTMLRVVLATQLDGSVTELPGTAIGDTFDVLDLTFCGTFEPVAFEDDPTQDAATEDETPADETTQDDAADDDASTPPSDPPASPEPPAASETPPATSGNATPEATSAPATAGTATDVADGAEALEVVPVDPPEAPTPPDTAAEPETTETTESVEEAEVLGVQLTREDDGGGNGLAAWVLALAVLALLGTAGGVVWSRRS